MDFTRAAEVTPDVENAVEDAFSYHPWDDAKKVHGGAVRRALTDAVLVIIRHAPPCPDRSAAIRKLREARMDANSAITHGGKY